MKNWYRIAKDLSKIAQIWVYKPDEEDTNDWNQERTFSSKVKEFHEMEYKLYMLRAQAFNGMPKRKENIERQLVKSLGRVAGDLQNVLLKVIGEWLESHALLTPNTWAEKRVETDAKTIEEVGEGNLLTTFLWEYDTYVKNSALKKRNIDGRDYSPYMYEILAQVSRNINQFPNFKSFIQKAFLPDYKNAEKEEAEYNLEDFNLSHNTKFENADQAEEWIDQNYTVDNIDVDSIFWGDIESFTYSLEQYGVLSDVVAELYKNFVFPWWYKHWSEKGIDKTRETIEDIYERLRQASPQDLKNLVMMVSMGLNAAHQTGDMTDYLERDLNEDGVKSTLDAIHKGAYTEKWNKDLREIGVQF